MLLAAGLAACAASEARAGSFGLEPIIIDLPASARSELLTVSSGDTAPLRIQVTAQAWSQGLRDDLVLTDTKDVSFYPSLFTLAPGEKKKIRIGVVRAAGKVERSYRVFVQELRPPVQGNVVPVLTRMGIPVFLAPRGAAVEGRIEQLSGRGGLVTFDLVNGGSKRFMAKRILVYGRGRDGASVFEHSGTGWYVLAGVARRYEVPVPKGACPGLAAVRVDAETDAGTFSAEAPVPEACGM